MKSTKSVFLFGLGLLLVVLFFTRDATSQLAEKALVYLQATLPGTAQQGNIHVTGTVKSNALSVGPGGIRFPDGSLKTSAAGDAVPAGAMIMTPSKTPPPGYEFTGQTIKPVAEWVPLPSPGTAFSNAAAVYVDDSVYVAGGRTSTSNALNQALRYDVATRTWQALPPLITARRSASAAESGGRIYVFGGMDAANSPVASCEVFDPGTQTWSPIAPMPQPREGFTATSIDGLIYCVGGWSPSHDFTARCDIYDPATNTWTVGPPMPETRAYHGAYYAFGRLQVIYGIHQEQVGWGEGCYLRDGAWVRHMVDRSLRVRIAFVSSPEWSPSLLYVFSEGAGNFIHADEQFGEGVPGPLGSSSDYVVVQDGNSRMLAIGSTNPQYVIQSAYARPMAIHMKLP